MLAKLFSAALVALALVSPARAAPGFAAEGEMFELVVRAEADRTLLFLAERDSNAPVEGATLDIEIAGPTVWSGRAAPAGAGIYAVDWRAGASPANLTAVVQSMGRDDLILIEGLRVEAPPAAPVQAAAPSLADWRVLVGGGAGLLLVAFGVGMRLCRNRAAPLALALILAPSLAFAHAGHDHGGATVGEALPPARAVAMTKESQFLLGIRTFRVEAREAADSVRLAGRVVPDPAGYARLQPSQSGRVLADPDIPIPHPGQRVKRGQAVAVLAPTLNAVDLAEQRAALYETETQIARTERQLSRWERIGDAVARKEVDDARGELERLRKKREQLAGTALGREVLTAPIDGVVTDSHLVPGEMLAPERTAVEIVDPERLRIEAVLHDLGLADRVVGGSAVSRQLPGRVFPLALVGLGGRIDPADQGLHLLFSVREGAGALKLGLPVDVWAETGAATLRVGVPLEAVLDAGGAPAVFVKTGPEAFERRPVRLGRMVGDWAEVAAGLEPGERVVVQGMAQLAAVR
ncbi:MAG: efflux RND transporter periplasmic adaptor subunit [Alphaproteobacteria bacterium]|nr:efflux RND transporter periplasmic adaptor subunit [Alphaproteobacteria bacterium]